MKKVVLLVALFVWIGFSASAQVQDSTKRKEHKGSTMKWDKDKDHWIMKDGKVMQVKNGVKTEMMTETQVGDVWIRTNGEVVMKDNKVVQLKNGQVVDHMGKIHTMMMKKKAKPKME